MFPFNMVERLWYVLLCLISNSQILLPIHSLSLRDGSGIQARVVGNSNGSTVHIVLQRSTADTVAEKVCPTGFYEHTRPARRTGRSAPATIVGRSGPRRSSNSGSRKLPNENEDDIVPLKLCLPCSVCKQDQSTKQPCTPTQDTICQQCGLNTDTGPCVHYDQVDINLATHPPRNDKSSNVQVTLDFSGKPDEVLADKSGHVPAPQDLNVNILKAGKDERNSWYFLSLCALIGLLVFLSLVMGAYLVSVKVTSWWRYQRPITVRRRGQSYHPESNHINLTTFPSSSQRYDDIIQGSREVTRPREVTPREAIKLVRGPEVVPSGPSAEESYPSTSASTSASTSGAPNPKIQVVHLRAGSSDFDSVASFDSFVMDGRGFPKARYVDRYYTAGCSWNGNVNKDSSDYSSDDDDDDDNDCGMDGGAIFSPSRPSAIPRTVRGNHLYQSLPLNESGSNDGSCKVHIVQWPSAVRTGYRSTFQMCMNGESSDHYHSAPTQRSVDDLHRGYLSGKHKSLISESSNSNTFPKNYHPMMNLKREYHDPHSVYTTQDLTGTISQEGCPTECTPLNHHSQSLTENSNPSSEQSTAASVVAGGLKYDHQFSHPPQRTKLDDRGAGYQTCQNFHEHRSKSDKSHSYPPIDCSGTFNEMTEANNGAEGPAQKENCEPHPSLQEGNHQDIASTSCTNHNTAGHTERAQPRME